MQISQQIYAGEE